VSKEIEAVEERRTLIDELDGGDNVVPLRKSILLCEHSNHAFSLLNVASTSLPVYLVAETRVVETILGSGNCGTSIDCKNQCRYGTTNLRASQSRP
jgi:hypothetical protein